MALTGSYTLVKSENLKEHLIAEGLPEQVAQKAAEHGKTLEIVISGNQVTLKRGGSVRPDQTLVFNQETEEKVGDNKVVKSTAVLNGDVLTIDTKRESHSSKRVFTLAGSELTGTLTSSKPGVPVAKTIYKKN